MNPADGSLHLNEAAIDSDCRDHQIRLRNMTHKKRTTIADMMPGPVRHPALPPELIVRIENVAAMLVDVDGRPASEWIRGFQIGQNPESEVVAKEAVAAAYVTLTKNRSLALDARQEVFGLLLLRFFKDGQSVLDSFSPKHLTHADVATVLAIFNTVAGTDEWGFRQPSVESSDAGEQFTVRDEANALTALAFRNGFIEELHAGKLSPLLEQPELSRITDAEMKKLMIEASEKLARMLALKRDDPDHYEAEIRDYHERYCQHWKRD